ncbi:unnamed protein product [Arctia plantaginis]|uniref:Uncharacterized protein n=1 Tax=Arctia plantaginis TaxID=874455 RepID=A0A8S1A723_ARCPL|nr:unnamed protein product [Arctia plantaginis]
MGFGGGVTGVAAGVLSAEVCAPLLLLCWLCCWPDDANSDSTSGKHPQRPVLAHVHESGSRRRSSDIFGRRIGSSAVSLHLPSTSGYKKPLSAHRSHEEIPRRRKSNHETSDQETRYHSAPSVIDEVLHRRDWERSSKDLYIPLNPEKNENQSRRVENQEEIESDSSESPNIAPYAEAESSSIEAKSDEHISGRTCKKHHTNIKSSRGKKEKESVDIKDSDATESTFYIGDTHEEETMLKNNDMKREELQTKSMYKAKDAKQSFNESVRSKERPRGSLAPVDETLTYTLGFCLDDVIEQLDRSGAEHHTIESRLSINRHIFPPPSVEPVGYDGGACYLAEVGDMSELRARAERPGPAPDARVAALGAMRARHASDGDILAPPHRPESGAFSGDDRHFKESDLDLEIEGSEERPPAYDEIHHYAAHDHKETAI